MQSQTSRNIFIGVACAIALTGLAVSRPGSGGGSQAMTDENQVGTKKDALAPASYDGQDGQIAFGAFEAADGTQADIWSVNTNGKHKNRLTNAPGLDICPAYSADGRQIAFCSDRTGAFEIWVMAANGKHERQVTDLGSYAVFPDFSPDGSTLVFAAEPVGGGNTDLWQVPTGGGEPTQLTHTPDTLEENPVWSPDGSTVLFARIAGDFSSGQLWSKDIATGLGNPTHLRPDLQGPDPGLEP